ncbi:MAG: hypothetical protein IJH47_05990 [Oscillospiraceae bacterium]|nr:hypothetical protein [Oscillospiraceae bacterium]
MTIEEAFRENSEPPYDYLLPHMNEIMAECPELTDGWKLFCAADKMQQAAEDGRTLSAREALELVKDAVEPTAEQAKQSEAEIARMFPPKPGFERPPSMREFFQRLFAPEEIPEEIVRPHDELHVRIAQNLLRRQAGELVRESCFDSLYVPEDDTDPWAITAAFRRGELSRHGQLTLQKMKHNSHASRLDTGSGVTAVSFILYRLD